jgi:hypothetical protein
MKPGEHQCGAITALGHLNAPLEIQRSSETIVSNRCGTQNSDKSLLML